MKKGENIRLRKDKRYEARYYDDQKRKYVSVYGKTYSEAKKKRNEIKYTLTTPQAVIEPSSTHSEPLKDILNRWLDGERYIIKKSTFAKYYDIVYKHIIPVLGKLQKNDITQEAIDDFIKNKLTNGRLDGKGGLSPKTVKDIINVLKSCLDSENLLFKYKVPTKKTSKIKILSDSDYYRLLNFLLLAPDCYKVSLLLTLFCGLRLGELCALRWQNIDLDKRIIKIKYTLQRIKNTDPTIPTKTVVILDTPKSEKSMRDIPIINFLYELLLKLKQNDNHYLLSGSKKYVEPRACQKIFKKYLKMAGIQDINFHALRHTFATKAIMDGMDAKSVSEILGHSDVRFTMNCYVHPDLEEKRKQLEKVCAIF